MRPFLGVVFQYPSLDNRLTVRENLVHGGRLYGLSGPTLTARIDEMLGHYRLSARASDLCGALSGGCAAGPSWPRVFSTSLKSFFSMSPRPASTPPPAKICGEHLMTLKAEGATILTTTHLMDEGDRCDRVAILDQGKIVAIGTLDGAQGRDRRRRHHDRNQRRIGPARRITKRFGVTPQAFGGQLRLERASGHAFIPQLVEAFPGRLRTVSPRVRALRTLSCTTRDDASRTPTRRPKKMTALMTLWERDIIRFFATSRA